jgi:peptidoglycan/LPS O-acetylase OafA/YrhL
MAETSLLSPETEPFIHDKYVDEEMELGNWPNIRERVRHLEASDISKSALRIMLVMLKRTMTPSFLQPQTQSKSVVKREPSTAALDGLRGFSAAIVVTYHWFLFFFNMNEGYRPGAEVFTNLPFVKFFSNGIAHVTIFFVISGYALSYKPLKLMRERSFEKLYTTLSSSIFRRYLRLYLPSCFNMLCLSILFWLGLNEPGRKHISEAWLIGVFYPGQPSSLYDALRIFVITVSRLSNIWSWDNYRPMELDSNMWTILIEFRASMVLFLVLIGVGRCPRLIRVGLIGVVTSWALFHGTWEVVLFMIGSLLADFDLAKDDNRTASDTPAKPWPEYVWTCLVLMGVYFASAPPTMAGNAYGYGWMASMAATIYPGDPHWFPWTIGGTILVFCATKPNFFQRFLISAPIQYLGHISFAMYIVHGELVRFFAYNLVPILWKIFGHDSTIGYLLSAILGYLIIWIFLIPISDVFWRYIDTSSISIARWVEIKMTV